MASTTAQDEYDHMFRTQNTRQNHPSDDSDSDNSSDFSSDDAENAASLQESAYPSVPTHSSSRSRAYLPNQRSYNNTGPKGVIADAQAFREAERAHRASLSLAGSTATAVNTHAQPYVENLSLNDSAHGGDASLKDEDDDDDGAGLGAEADEGLEVEESEFMRVWREQRLVELRGKSVIASNAAADRWGMGRSAKLVYEGLTQVDGEGFLEVVDGSPRGVVVVVFVWDDRVCLCPTYRPRLSFPILEPRLTPV